MWNETREPFVACGSLILGMSIGAFLKIPDAWTGLLCLAGLALILMSNAVDYWSDRNDRDRS